MQDGTYFRAQAFNNAWANHRLLKACGQLSQNELEAARTSFFPSIIATLNHILIADWFYVSALEGRCIGYAAFRNLVPHPAIEELDREQRAVDSRLISVCGNASDGGLAGDIELLRGEIVQKERFGRTLLHLFEHQIHHRG